MKRNDIKTPLILSVTQSIVWEEALQCISACWWTSTASFPGEMTRFSFEAGIYEFQMI